MATLIPNLRIASTALCSCKNELIFQLDNLSLKFSHARFCCAQRSKFHALLPKQVNLLPYLLTVKRSLTYQQTNPSCWRAAVVCESIQQQQQLVSSWVLRETILSIPAHGRGTYVRTDDDDPSICVPPVLKQIRFTASHSWRDRVVMPHQSWSGSGSDANHINSWDPPKSTPSFRPTEMRWDVVGNRVLRRVHRRRLTLCALLPPCCWYSICPIMGVCSTRTKSQKELRLLVYKSCQGL